MGLFSNLLNPHRTRWKMKLNKISASSNEAYVIRKFFLIDNINFDTYEQNKQARNFYDKFGDLEAPDFRSQNQFDLLCSPSFKKILLSEEYLNSDYYPDWFIRAYPDIIVWRHVNNFPLGKITANLNTINSLPDFDPKNMFQLFRSVIDNYKLITKKTLECSS